MSLRVWLPLTDGTLKQQGPSNSVVTSSGTVVLTNAGKLGKCATFGSAAGGLTIPASAMTSFTNACSVAFWLKINGWGSSYDTYFQAGLGSTPWAHYIFGFLRNNANSTMCFTISNGTNASNANYLSSALSTGVWYHVALTYETGKCKIYLNGSLDHEYSTSIVPNFSGITKITLGRCNNDSNYQTQCGMNDVRIYDHTLSPLEVKEISQGLVLHYPLNGNNETLVPLGYQQLEYIEGAGSSYLNTGYYFNPETDSFKVIFKGNDTSNNGMIFASSGGRYIWLYYYGSSGIRMYANNGSGQQRIVGIARDLNIHTAEYKNKHYIIDNVDKGSFSNTYTTDSSPIWLFSYGGSGYPFKGRIYYVSIFRNNQTQKIYIPAKRLSDSAVGMFELINKEFFISTSTAFTAGPTVATPSKIIDCSGYGNDGLVTGTLSSETDGARYDLSTKFSDGSYIVQKLPETMYEATYSFWVKSSSYAGYGVIYSPITNPSTGTSPWLSVNTESRKVWAYFGNNNPNYTKGDSGSISTGEWHHCVYVWNNGVAQWYLDGEISGSSVTYTTRTFIQNTTNTAIGDSYTGTSWGGTPFTGSISDFRIYATALSEAGIKALYNTSANIDNLGNFHSFEFVEDDRKSIDKNGITHTSDIVEYKLLERLKYDKTIYKEPDGSSWIRVAHHNNPTTSGYFNRTDDWDNGVYLSADKWYNMDAIESISTWEFMVKQKTTSSATETKYRWVQYKSPFVAAWADVKPGTVTFNTSTGYSSSSYGGLWQMNSNARLCIANSSSGNWYGAFGCWTTYNTNNIPGYPNTNISTGYMDLYVRVPDANIKDDGTFTANEFIEK